MRVPVLLIGLIAIAPAFAETPPRPRADPPASTAKVLPLKRAASACAAYGAGFVRVEGTGTCVKLGGSVDVGVAASSRR